MRRAQHSHRRPHSEAGFTMIEIMVTSALLMVVLALVLPLIGSSLNLFTNTQVRSDAVDSSQVAFSQISHDMVSSNLLYLDTTGATPIVHLQSYATGGTSACVEYQVQYPPVGQTQVGVLQRRTKAPGSASTYPTSWSTVMTGIVNSSRPSPAPAVFSIPASSQDQSLVVDLWVQLDTRRAATAAAPQNYTSTFTGSAIPANAAATANPTSEPC